MKWYIKCLIQYANFRGRARREEFWMFTLFDTILILILGFISIDLLFPLLIYILVTLLPRFAVTVRRLHDTGRSGWMVLLHFFPLIGQIILLGYMIEDSDYKNEYGEVPIQVEEEEEEEEEEEDDEDDEDDDEDDDDDDENDDGNKE
jgi:uncharacterized membrane protein YhaH (DUF805 family)